MEMLTCLSFLTYRTAVSAVADRMIAHSYHMMSKTLFEEDRPLFAILSAIEVCLY